jgi:nucleoside-diphosphate-sugar epimerase
MAGPLPSLIVTGASGIVGRNFLQAVSDRFRIFAIARRAQQRAGIAPHPNIEWVQVDVGNRDALRRVTSTIESQGGADYVLHLAAHYDYDNVDRPEYERTNVIGTHNVLEQARHLRVKRFIFASSIAACPFPAPGTAVDETTEPSAEFPYARSKRIGERMVAQQSRWFPCSIVRLAAVYSDWCEYPPLYVFLSTWLSDSWRARVLGGRGETAVPFIHTLDLNRIFLTIIGKSSELPPLRVYCASQDGATSHRELFGIVTRFHFGRTVRPLFVPKAIAAPTIVMRDAWGRLRGKRPFERPWMIPYMDRALRVDPSRTRSELDWSPRARLHVLRRTLFMIEKMKSKPLEWHTRNEAALEREQTRPALLIHDAMMQARGAIVDAITDYLQSPARGQRFPHYARMDAAELSWNVTIVYELLMAAVRTGDRTLLLGYMEELAYKRRESGFPADEVCDALLAVNQIIVEQLMFRPSLQGMQDALRDSVTLSIALAIDSVQDAYESGVDATATSIGFAGSRYEGEIERIVERLNAFYRPESSVASAEDARVPETARPGGA